MLREEKKNVQIKTFFQNQLSLQSSITVLKKQSYFTMTKERSFICLKEKPLNIFGYVEQAAKRSFIKWIPFQWQNF